MVKIDKNQIEMNGSLVTILNELAALLHNAIKRVSKDTGMAEEKILMDILDMRKVSILIEAGMNPIEAAETVMPGKVKQIIEKDKEGKEVTFDVNSKPPAS